MHLWKYTIFIITTLDLFLHHLTHYASTHLQCLHKSFNAFVRTYYQQAGQQIQQARWELLHYTSINLSHTDAHHIYTCRFSCLNQWPAQLRGTQPTPRAPLGLCRDGYGACGGSMVLGTELHRETAGLGRAPSSMSWACRDIMLRQNSISASPCRLQAQ